MILVSLKCSIISLQISERCTVIDITPRSSLTLEQGALVLDRSLPLHVNTRSSNSFLSG